MSFGGWATPVTLGVHPPSHRSSPRGAINFLLITSTHPNDYRLPYLLIIILALAHTSCKIDLADRVVHLSKYVSFSPVISFSLTVFVSHIVSSFPTYHIGSSLSSLTSGCTAIPLPSRHLSSSGQLPLTMSRFLAAHACCSNFH